MGFFRAAAEKKANTPRDWPASRVRQYRIFLGHLDEFSEHFYEPLWTNLNVRFREDFKDYSFELKGHANNTMVKNVSMFKALLSDAVQEGHITEEARDDFVRLWRGHAREDVPELTYLTRDELERIRNVEAEADSKWARVRDLCIAQAFTGFRYSGLETLNDSMFGVRRDQQTGEDINVISVVQRKIKTVLVLKV